jgi:Ca-activated chloride channel family protein
VRGLFCRRHRERARLIVALLAFAIALDSFAHTLLGAGGNPQTPAIEITSPLGRTGLPGKVRIVARITTSRPDAVVAVRFYVDNVLIGTDTDGPPYAVEWDDANPYERTRLRAEFDDPIAGVVRHEIELPSFDIVEETSVMSVALEASVQDAKGHFVGKLPASEFSILEDGHPQTLDSASSEATPATFAILVDSSQSMSRSIEFVQSAAGKLTRYLRDIDSVVLAPFRNGITNVTGPTRDAATIIEAVKAIKPSGGTAILDALKDVSTRFGDGAGRRIVVLITDGYDERSQGDADEILDKLKSSRVTVYVISIGGVAGVSIRGERLLRRIASETGGRAFFPWNEQQLADAHALITEDVQHQYRLTYTPINQVQDGTWRAITVSTVHPEYRVVARAGYRAPVPPPIRASMEFIATDGRKQPVDLTAGDLEILEDGVPQKVETFSESIAPVSIMLALDASGSMTRAVETARSAALAFVHSLRKDDPLGVIVFSDKVALSHDLSTHRELSEEAIQAYEANGGTALYDALGDAVTRLKTVNGRRVVVLVTDGRDENAASNGPGSQRTWEQALNEVSAVEATVYAIGIGTRVERERLEQVAALTGGEAYLTNDVSELEGNYHRIVEELRRRYQIGYTSTNPKRDGSWRKVEIRSKGLLVRSRGGYFAPSR